MQVYQRRNAEVEAVEWDGDGSPTVAAGDMLCAKCGFPARLHGILVDTVLLVCPGDFIVTDETATRKVFSAADFHSKFVESEEPDLAPPANDVTGAAPLETAPPEGSVAGIAYEIRVGECPPPANYPDGTSAPLDRQRTP